MTYIFISHSTKDNDFTRKLAADLNNAGIETWVDLDSIESGERWLLSIQKGIEECGAMVVVMSRNGRDSEWVEREALLAMDLKKPIHTALIEDIPLPLHLINRQFTDFRGEYDKSLEELTDALWALDRSAAPRRVPDKLSPQPNTDNFFDYIAQLPGGDQNSMIATALFEWGQQNASRSEFGGKITPGFHVRLDVGRDDLTVFSVWAYPRQPAVQIQFGYLADFAPYDRLKLRRSTLKSLNRLMDEPFLEDKADRRPTIPLVPNLDSAEKLELFQQIMAEIIDNLRSG